MPKARQKKRRRAPGEITVRGFVVADDWNYNDEVVAVSISTEDEEEYLVENTGLGKRLLNHVDDLVEVTGMIRTDVGGFKNIKVTDFTVLDFG